MKCVEFCDKSLVTENERPSTLETILVYSLPALPIIAIVAAATSDFWMKYLPH